MSKEKEIIDLIISIPFDKWNGFMTYLNGVQIVINPGHGNTNPIITIEGVDFSGEKINDLVNKLRDYQKEQYFKIQEEKQNNIYNKLRAIKVL